MILRVLGLVLLHFILQPQCLCAGTLKGLLAFFVRVRPCPSLVDELADAEAGGAWFGRHTSSSSSRFCVVDLGRTNHSLDSMVEACGMWRWGGGLCVETELKERWGQRRRKGDKKKEAPIHMVDMKSRYIPTADKSDVRAVAHPREFLSPP